MVDAVVSLFFDKLVTLVKKQAQIVLDFPNELNSTKESVGNIQSFLKDIEKNKRGNETLCRITDELRELMYNAEDILADCSTGIFNSKSVLGGLLPRKMYSRHKIGRELKNINQSIKNIESKISSFLQPSLTIQNRDEELANDQNRWNAPLLDETQIVGLEGAVIKIKNWIFEAQTGFTRMGFVGMGGLGKTTLAEKVLKDKKIIDHFEKKMFVSVSQPVDEEKIMRSMLKHLGDVSSDGDKREMLTKIQRYLDGKRCVLVLDDVWKLEGGWWTRLESCLPKENGSCVVITSRNIEIVRKMRVDDDRIHKPDFLTDEEGWTLFSKIVFAGRNDLSGITELKDIGIEIVRKCHGLPLAIKAVGGAVASLHISPGEWRRIMNTFTDLLSENPDFDKASLQLSYDELPTYLKPCLLCFSIFPEDCIVLRDELTRWWIGEGFVPLKGGRLLVESAEDCFMGLINRCLVEVVERDYNGKVYTCKMHDLVRDLVIKMGKSEAFYHEDNNISRRMPVNDGNGGTTNQIRTINTKKLRAVVSVTNCRSVGNVTTAFLEKICGCEYIRVLDLSESISETHFKVMLSKLDTLRHLTYLNLRNTHPMLEVPTAICNLRRLLVLDLSFCQILKTLPSCITNLKELMLLDVSCCGSLKYLPKGLGFVSTLQVIKGFKPSRPCFTEGCKFEELRNLTQLMTLEMVVDRDDEISDGEFDALSNLDLLRHLTISCFNSYGSDLFQKLEKLHLPQNLNEINLKYYPGVITPTWLNPSSLPNLQYLSLCSGNFTHFHQRFYEGAKWGIIGLMFELLPDLDEDWNKVSAAMPYLRLLNASWCPKLETFPIENIEFEGGVWRRQLEHKQVQST